MEGESTLVMVAVSESTINGYPHASISSKGAFEWTLNKIVRSNTSGFKLLFLHVQVPDEDGFEDMDSIFASPEDFKGMKNRDKIRGLHLLEYFVNRCHEIGVPCEAWTKKGDPKEIICHEVKRVQPDLLVVGCRGLGPFQRAFWSPKVDAKGNIEPKGGWGIFSTISNRVFVGTVSEFCVKHAECPVVTIKRSAAETPQDPIDD